MVGVAGGSRGCDNCKRRKIKCDETFPKCLRCVKSNRDCGGPVVGPVFRRQRVGTVAFGHSLDCIGRQQLHQQQLHLRRPRKPTVEGLRISKNHNSFALRREQLDLLDDSEQDVDSLALFAPVMDSIPREPNIFPEYNLYSYCVSVFFSWFSLYGFPSRFMDDKVFVNWISALPAFVLSPTETATTCAARALLLTQCSAIVQSRDVELVGASWYGKALRRQNALVDAISSSDIYSQSSESSSSASSSPSPSTYSSSPISAMTEWFKSNKELAYVNDSTIFPKSSLPPSPPSFTVSKFREMRGNNISFQDDSIIAGMLLTVYEMFRFSTSTSWMPLLSGVCELMRLRGPQAYSSGLNQVLFQCMRPAMIMLAIGRHERSFLNEPDWQTIPWSNTSKPVSQRLLDIALPLPDLIESFQEFFMFAYSDTAKTQDERELLDQSSGGLPQVQLRHRYRTSAWWKELAKHAARLAAIDDQLDQWLEEYKVNVAEYYENSHDMTPEQLKAMLDPLTGALITEQRCSEVSSDEEWTKTHFFHRRIDGATMHDCRLILLFYSMKVVMSYLQQLAVPVQVLSFEEYSMEPDAVQSRHEVAQVVSRLRKQGETSAYIVARSMSSFLRRNANAAIMNFLFPLGFERSPISDPYELGWIWNQLALSRAIRVDREVALRVLRATTAASTPAKSSSSSSSSPLASEDHQVFVEDSSEPSLFKFLPTDIGSSNISEELALYLSLPICPGCGERTRSE
ncbi:uncharacterized protein V1516DRAFT_682423 [Lipomyces oligophaga]|uniref:uncharacterized protein n=1 Tax=Lipomyces oligophaga TaxID=45792 RepID=UPI0034CD3544